MSKMFSSPISLNLTSGGITFLKGTVVLELWEEVFGVKCGVCYFG